MRLLLISSNYDATGYITSAFVKNGFEIVSVSTLPEAQDILLHQWVPLILVDGEDEKINAIDLYNEIQQSILLLNRIVLLIHSGGNIDWRFYPQTQLFCDVITYSIEENLLNFKIQSIKNQLKDSKQYSDIAQLIHNENRSSDSNFSSLVQYIAEVLTVKYALISHRTSLSEWRTKVLSFWNNGDWGKTFEYDLKGAPCEAVFRKGPQWYGNDIQQLFPEDSALRKLDIQFYYGVPLKDHLDEIVGHLCVLHDKPVSYDVRLIEVVKLYAQMASKEIMLNQSQTPLRRKAVRFHSKMSELQKARNYLMQFHEGPTTQPTICSLQKLMLAVNEAAANIIQHAYDGKEEFHWEMIIEEFHDRWAVSLLHDGVPFDPDQIPKPVFDGSCSSGFGVYIIKESVDEVVYGRHEDGRCLIQLIKRFQALKG